MNTNVNNNSIAVKADFTPIEFKSKSAALNDSIERYNALAAQVGLAVGNARAVAAEAKKKAAVIFYGWREAKLYEKDGFKSLSEMVEKMGLKASEVNKAIRYAEANKKYNNAFDNMTVDNYATINSAVKADAARVVADAKDGKFAEMKQPELKDYNNKVIAETPQSKSGKAVTLYHAFTVDGKEVDEPRSLADWLTYWNSDNYAVKPLSECKTDNGDVFKVVVPFDFSKPPYVVRIAKEAKTDDNKKAAEIRESTIKVLAALNANGKTGVNDGLAKLGFEPLIEAECAKYNLI